MKCRNCGAEIADKALICYRCGTATTDAKYQPAALPRGRRRGPQIAIIVFVIALVVLALLYYVRSAKAFALHRSTEAVANLHLANLANLEHLEHPEHPANPVSMR